jgi:hypothetical protein
MAAERSDAPDAGSGSRISVLLRHAIRNCCLNSGESADLAKDHEAKLRLLLRTAFSGGIF